MKNKRANLSCVRTVLLQAGKGHAARTTIKQNYKTNIFKNKCSTIYIKDRTAFTKQKLFQNKSFILKNKILFPLSPFSSLFHVENKVHFFYKVRFMRQQR